MNPLIKSNLKIFSINETEHWNLDYITPENKVKVFGVYFVDINQKTYCAETTPSNRLYFLENVLIFPSNVSEKEKEEIKDRFDKDGCHNMGEDIYLNGTPTKTSDLSRLNPVLVKEYVKLAEDEAGLSKANFVMIYDALMSDIIEDLKANGY